MRSWIQKNVVLLGGTLAFISVVGLGVAVLAARAPPPLRHAVRLPEVEPEPVSPATFEAILADGGYRVASGAPELWWNAAGSSPEDDAQRHSDERVAFEEKAEATLAQLKKLSGVSLAAGLGPRPPLQVQPGTSVVLEVPVQNLGGLAGHLTLRLDGSAVAAGLVRFDRVVLVSPLQTATRAVGDAGWPLTLDFEPFTIGPAPEGEPGTEDARLLDQARGATVSILVHGVDAGRGELNLWLGGDGGVGGRLRRIQVEVGLEDAGDP